MLFIISSESKIDITILKFNRPNHFLIELSQKGGKLHDDLQYMSQQSGPSVNCRSAKPVVIFDSVFLSVLSCISFFIDCSVQQKGEG